MVQVDGVREGQDDPWPTTEEILRCGLPSCAGPGQSIAMGVPQVVSALEVTCGAMYSSLREEQNNALRFRTWRLLKTLPSSSSTGYAHSVREWAGAAPRSRAQVQ